MKPELRKVENRLEDRYIIATDLDGTFLGHGGNMTHHVTNYKAVQKLKEMGHIVVLASGRSPQLIKPVYEHLGLETPVVAFHGGLILDPTGLHGDLELLDKSMSKAVINEIVSETEIMDSTVAAEYIGYNKSNSFTDRADLDLIDYDGYEIMFATERGVFTKEDADRMLAKWNSKIDWIFMPGGSGLDVDMILLVAPRVNKANALERLSMYYRIPKERIIYFGDNTNDIEALHYAGHGVAMVSGKSHVKEIADAITDKSASQGGMGHYILTHLIKE